jgi:hypothetical protein
MITLVVFVGGVGGVGVGGGGPGGGGIPSLVQFDRRPLGASFHY